ncbi:MAG: hypothetical protein WCF16_03350 [Alphaproteobacteria bacterium]
MCFSRIIEKLFPFGHYLVRSRRQRRHCTSKNILSEQEFARYSTLAVDQLTRRLEDERQRASAMDEKTFKLTLSLSVGLTVLGSTVALLVNGVSSPTVQIALIIMIGLGLFYVLAAGFVAVGALRTLPSYGYGTRFLLDQSVDPPQILADALARQETMNVVRHLRNEAAYQAMRNGLLFLFAGIMVFAGTLAYEALCPGY